MDKELPEKAKIVLAFNKIDLLMEKSQKNSVEEECSRITEIVSSKKNEGHLKILDGFILKNLQHEYLICKCSGKYKIGINSLMKKIFRLGMNSVMGTD